MSSGSIPIPELLQPEATPELGSCGLRRWRGGPAGAAIVKDHTNDPSRTAVKVALPVGRQDPIDLDCDGGEVGPTRVLTDLPVDAGVECSISKPNERVCDPAHEVPPCGMNRRIRAASEGSMPPARTDCRRVGSQLGAGQAEHA